MKTFIEKIFYPPLQFLGAWTIFFYLRELLTKHGSAWRHIETGILAAFFIFLFLLFKTIIKRLVNKKR